MKILLATVFILAQVACAAQPDGKGGGGGGGGSGSGSGSGSGGSGGSGGGADQNIVCNADDCICGDDGLTCTHSCTPGAFACHVQGMVDPVNIKCDGNNECHVECSASASCSVDCDGSAQCHVACPETGCTVNNCVGPNCVVSCGLTQHAATRTATTATCP